MAHTASPFWTRAHSLRLVSSHNLFRVVLRTDDVQLVFQVSAPDFNSTGERVPAMRKAVVAGKSMSKAVLLEQTYRTHVSISRTAFRYVPRLQPVYRSAVSVRQTQILIRRQVDAEI